MGKIRKIKDLYYIDFVARGLLYSQVAGKDLDEAKRLLRQVEEKIAGGEALTIARHIELPDFFERFIDEARIQHPYGPKSVQRFMSTIDHFSSFLTRSYPQVHQLAQLTPAVIESYRMHLVKTQKPKIVNLTILLIRDILEFGIKLGFLNDNPSLHIRLLPWAPQNRVIKVTPRFELARQLLPKGVGLAKFSQLLKLSDISKAIYYGNLIPLDREDTYVF